MISKVFKGILWCIRGVPVIALRNPLRCAIHMYKGHLQMKLQLYRSAHRPFMEAEMQALSQRGCYANKNKCSKGNGKVIVGFRRFRKIQGVSECFMGSHAVSGIFERFL